MRTLCILAFFVCFFPLILGFYNHPMSHSDIFSEGVLKHQNRWNSGIALLGEANTSAHGMVETMPFSNGGWSQIPPGIGNSHVFFFEGLLNFWTGGWDYDHLLSMKRNPEAWMTRKTTAWNRGLRPTSPFFPGKTPRVWGVPYMMRFPQWMVDFMENPNLKWMMTRGTSMTWETSISTSGQG